MVAALIGYAGTHHTKMDVCSFQQIDILLMQQFPLAILKHLGGCRYRI